MITPAANAEMVSLHLAEITTQAAGGAIACDQGRIKVDAEKRTSVKGIWAGGDCIAGGKDLTVASVDDGRRAAESIHAYLSA